MKPTSPWELKDRWRLWWLQRSLNPVHDIILQGNCAANDVGVLLRGGAMDVVALLSQSATLDVNLRDIKGLAALHHAAGAVSLPTIKVLLKHGADVGLCDKLGRTAAHHAARMSAAMGAFRHQAYACVDALVAAGADLDSQDVYHQTVLETGGRTMGMHYRLLGSDRCPAPSL